MTITRIGKTERLSRVVVHDKIAYFSGLTADDRGQDTRGQTSQILAKADGFLEKVGSNRSMILSATLGATTLMAEISTAAPLGSTIWELRNHTASMAYANARVTTPNVRPRSRRAGRLITTPMAVAKRAAMIGARGNGIPQLTVRKLSVYPPAPARASCASETCPA